MFLAPFLLILAVGVLPSKVWANQEPSRESQGGASTAPSAAPERTAAQEQALQHLESLFEAATNLEDSALRIRIQARIADALWEHDQWRARGQFEETFRAIGSIPSDSRLKLELRTEVLSFISARDLDLAEELARSAADTGSAAGGAAAEPSINRFQTPELSLRLAMSVAATDPERAAQLAKAGLEGGAIRSPLALELLQTIRQERPALADELFVSAMSTARQDPANATFAIGSLARYLFADFGAGIGGRPASRAAAGAASPALIRRFLEFVDDTVRQPQPATVQAERIPDGLADPRRLNGRAMTRAAVDRLTVQQLLPYFDHYMPDRAAAIRGRIDERLEALPSVAEREFVRNLSPAGSATSEEMLAQASRARTALERDSLYMQAAMMASREGEHDRALSIAGRIGDQWRGQFDVESSIRVDAAMKALGERDVEAAYLHARRLTDVQQRTRLFSQMVAIVLGNGDAGRASDLLSEAETFLTKAEDGPSKVSGLFSLVPLAARLDPTRGFDMLGSAVRAFNRLDASVGPNTVNVEPAVTVLARTDFIRTLETVQTIERSEVSVLAQLAACRGALVGPVK